LFWSLKAALSDAEAVLLHAEPVLLRVEPLPLQVEPMVLRAELMVLRTELIVLCQSRFFLLIFFRFLRHNVSKRTKSSLVIFFTIFLRFSDKIFLPEGRRQISII